MVDGSFVMVVEFFEILYKIVDSLRIEKLISGSASLSINIGDDVPFLSLAKALYYQWPLDIAASLYRSHLSYAGSPHTSAESRCAEWYRCQLSEQN